LGKPRIVRTCIVATGTERRWARQVVFDLFTPDDDVVASTTDLLRSVGTFLYGRRLYESMAVWETDAALAASSDRMADFATAWQPANKVVYQDV
jgi:hypothetical protein